jgi:hypothetical protein
MATDNAAFLSALSQGGQRLLLFHGDNAWRTLKNTHTAMVTFFRVNRE